MANDGEGSQNSPEKDIKAVARELMLMHTQGAGMWKSRRSAHLAAIERITGLDTAQAVWDHVRAHCKGLEDPLGSATLAFLGYPRTIAADDTKQREQPPAKTRGQRLKAAGAGLGRNPRNLGDKVKAGRWYGERKFDSDIDAMLIIAAEAIVNTGTATIAQRQLLNRGLTSAPCPLVDTYDYYNEPSLAELDKGFFARPSTHQYVDDIASCVGEKMSVTILAGSGASPDIGDPMRSGFMERMLFDALVEAVSLPPRDISSESLASLISRVVAASVVTYPAAYLGSAVREVVSRGGGRGEVPADREQQLRSAISKVLDAGYVPGRFLARAIATCAFAMRRAKANVTVLTTSFDAALIDASAHARTPNYLPPGLAAYEFLTLDPEDSPECTVTPTQVAVAHINGSTGHPSVPLIIGEGQVFAQHSPDDVMATHSTGWRDDLLEKRLLDSTVIIVGNTLNDPAVQAWLARTKYCQRRYALLLQAPAEATTSPDRSEGEELIEHYVKREIVARRFLHLGVVPIIADHPHHIPQFLHEVALRIMQGDNYIDYYARSIHWWDYWSDEFGYQEATGAAGPRSRSLQEHWHDKPLAKAMQYLESELLKDEAEVLEEKLVMEVWLRNPHRRELVLWARSDSLWLDSSTAHRTSLERPDDDYFTQQTFETGIADGGPLNLIRGESRYCWSLPLVLYKAPWYHTPIGVLNVLSNMTDHEWTSDGRVHKPTRLWDLADRGDTGRRERIDEVEETLKQIILRELDPRTSTWSKRQTWSSYWETATGKKPTRRHRGGGNA
jgi:hypothetical protein